MKKIILFLLMGIFLLSFASAQIQSLGTFKLGDDINLIQTCDNCTFNNITSVLYPNSTQTIGESEMTKTGTLYNFTLSSDRVTEIGTYIVNGFGDLDGIDTVWNYNFQITTFGTTLQNSGVVYGVLLLIFFFMDLVVLFIIVRLNKENFKDEEGNFVGISIQKYVRVVLIGVFYGLIVITLNLMNAAANTTSQISQFSGIIGGIFSAMLSAAWVWTIIIVIWIAMMSWRDADFVNQMKKKLKELEEMN